jgi:hypothetical protein
MNLPKKSTKINVEYILFQDFLMATNPATFFICINLPEDFQLQEAICLNNGKTKERLLTKMEVVKVNMPENRWEEVYLLISRYPQASTKKWIVDNEKEILDWDFSKDNDRKIYLTDKLKIGAI